MFVSVYALLGARVGECVVCVCVWKMCMFAWVCRCVHHVCGVTVCGGVCVCEVLICANIQNTST